MRWEMAWKVRVASGWALVSMPFHGDVRNPITPAELRKVGTVKALEVMGSWYWVKMTSPEKRTVTFCGAFSLEQLEQLGRVKNLCHSRVDTSPNEPLRYAT